MVNSTQIIDLLAYRTYIITQNA